MSLLTPPRPATPTPAPPPAAGAGPTPAPRAPWERPALVALLLGTAVLYLWGLSSSGYANSFYSAAAQAGSESWKAMFFGSSDAANAITVDKTPLALWPMDLSVRIFGLSSWSILVPQAVEGVAAVGLLFATVRRATGSAGAALLSGATLALTPVAVLMFRFDNPDAMLVLLLIGAVYAILRAVESSRTLTGEAVVRLVGHPVRWLALAGVLVGLAFLAKMLQAFLVIPALGLVYLVCAESRFVKRVGHLLVGLAAMVASAGWWIAIVSLWPADSRPYIGGSQHNSILELTLGYNGFGRLTGDETGSVGGGAGGSSMWGETGIGRLFDSEIGGQVAWLIPAALVLLGAGLWFTRRAPRVDATRATLIVWGTWLLVTGLTFSFMAGIFHPYYTVALAPAIAALVGTGAWLVWCHRSSLVAAAVAAATTALTAVLAFELLGRTSDFLPWLRWVVLVGGLVAALAVAGIGLLPRRLAAAVAAAALLAGLAGPAAYAVDTATTAHTGSIPSAGPGSVGFGGFGGMPGGRGGFGGTPPGGTTPGGAPGGTTTQGQTQGRLPGGGAGGGAGGLLDASTSSAKITTLLQTNAGEYTWVAAAVGSNTAAGYQLASEEPVMAIGGFNVSDPSPTLGQFKAEVAAGEIHYFIASSGFGNQNGGSSDSSEIASWVEATYTATTVDGVTLYDLTSAE